MTTEKVKRKLAGILSADVKGYSRLMGEDEVGTIRTLTSYREIMANLIQENNGRVVDSPGDNVLAEFMSVVDAVECAVEIQKKLKTKNTELPESRRMEFRIWRTRGQEHCGAGSGVPDRDRARDSACGEQREKALAEEVEMGSSACGGRPGFGRCGFGNLELVL
jgi:hypothetical protein